MSWFRSLGLEKIGQRPSSVPEIKKILYQLYKPQPKDCVTVELHIGRGRRIRSWPWTLWSSYSVNVCYPLHHFYRTNVQETDRKRALLRHKWNQNLTFHIEKSKSDVIHCAFEFQLKETTLFGTEYVIDTKTYTLEQILQNGKVIFKNKKEINVGVNKNDIVKCIPDIRIRDQNTLCNEENKFYHERRKKIEESAIYNEIWNVVQGKNERKDKHPKLRKLKSVPNIAVIGSGGGMRAVVGMSGAMNSLEKSNMLDLAMYTAGVSGSSWYISTLYTSSEYRLCPSGVKESIKQSLACLDTDSEAALGLWAYALVYTGLSKYFETGKYRSFTDVWGYAIGAILLSLEGMFSTWSSQTAKLERADVPLPLLAMLHVYDKENPEELNEWIECSPYEVFVPKYCTGIDMKHFGSEFNGGFVKTKYPEQPIHVLQGICGSAYIDMLEPKAKDGGAGIWSQELASIMEKLEDKTVGEIPNWLYGVSDIQKLFEEKDITRNDITKDDIKSMKKVITNISWTDISKDDKSSMEKVIDVVSKTDFSADDVKRREKVRKNISEDELNSMTKIFTDISREEITEGDINSLQKVFKEITEGDINNLEFVVGKDITEYDVNSMKTVIDDKREALMLTDAGIAFNSPYPLVLHPARKIDLIMSFEFSAPDYSQLSEWPFSELQKAQKWAECRNIPFPDLREIDTYKKEAIKDLYVFKGQNSPTIMHFVMYKTKENETRTDCESKVLNLFKKYETLKFSYSKDDFDWLSNLMEHIVEKHMKTIRHQIEKAIETKVHRESHVKTE